jgi:DNA-directed RNA polymerase specialized sigma24 family protein
VPESHVKRVVPQDATYAVIEQLPVRVRVAFCLHYLAQLDIAEVAELCDISRAAARRAVLSGKALFLAGADAHAELAPWLP